MAAKSPQQGNDEYKRILLARQYYRLFSDDILHIGGGFKQKRKILAVNDPVKYLAELTGAEYTQETKRKFACIRQFNYAYKLLQGLDDLLALSAFNNLLKAYKGKQISRELLAILEQEPGKIPRRYETSDKAVVIANLIKAGKADFTPFRKKKDTEQNWYFFYRIDFSPLTVFQHSIKLLESALEGKESLIKQGIKNIILGLLEGHPAFEGIPERKPVKPAELLAIVELIEYQYNRRITDKTPPEKAAPFTLSSAGFYLNPETGEIKDLRDFTGEINQLLTVTSWDYLQKYTQTAREAISSFDEQGKQEPLFAGVDFVPLRNTPETLAISSLTTGLAPLCVQPALPGLDGSVEHAGDIILNKDDHALRMKVKDQPNGRGFRPGTQKVKTLLEAVYTQRKKRRFSFLIRDYMRLKEPNKPESYYTGVQYRKFAGKLRADLKLIYNASFSANYPGLPAGEIRILDGYAPGPNGSIEISLGEMYCRELLDKGGISQICRTFWQSDERNPHVIPFLLKLCGNRTNSSNIIKGGKRANTISLKSLFDHDRINFPAMEKVKKSRKYKELLLDPILKTIAQLNDEGHITSKYVNANHEEYTAEELSRVSFTDFMDSKKWLLEYEINGFEEDRNMIIEAKERKQKKAAAKRRKTTKKKPATASMKEE